MHLILFDSAACTFIMIVCVCCHHLQPSRRCVLQVARLLQRVRIHDVVPSEAIFVRTYDAVQYCKAKLATAEGGEGGHYDVIKSEYILYGLDGKPSLT